MLRYLVMTTHLVMTGPKAPPGTSRGQTRPWVITEVFLFDAPELVKQLRSRDVKLGVAAYVRKREWEEARVYVELGNELPLQVACHGAALSGRAGRVVGHHPRGRTSGRCRGWRCAAPATGAPWRCAAAAETGPKWHGAAGAACARRKALVSVWRA